MEMSILSDYPIQGGVPFLGAQEGLVTCIRLQP